jgi:hypothetical protein
VWSGKSLFPELQTTQVGQVKTMKRVQLNSKTLEWHFEDKYYDSGTKTMKDYTDRQGKCKAVHQYATMMSLAQYHNDM